MSTEALRAEVAANLQAVREQRERGASGLVSPLFELERALDRVFERLKDREAEVARLTEILYRLQGG